MSNTSKMFQYPKDNYPKRNKNNNTSHSRSKSPMYQRKKKFYFKQKSVFLTYPHTEKGTPINKYDLGLYLYDNLKASITVVCEEKHQDGNPHLHGWIEWENEFYTSNYRVFDYKDHHPHIGSMKNKLKNTRNNVLSYMLKQDTHLFTRGINIEEWKYSSTNKIKYICQDLISGNVELPEMVDKNPNLLMNYTKLKTNLASYKLDKAPHTNPFRTQENLWIYSPPGTGKTYYATHLYPSFYLKPQSKWWDGYTGQPVVILDDYDDPRLSHYIKIWADNYNTVGEIKNGSINLNYNVFIITSNYMPLYLWPNDRELRYAIYRRFNFASISGTFPNYKRIPIDNPINTDFKP